MVAHPLVKVNKTKKVTKKFIRCEFEDYPGRLKATWRKPRGIDNTCRRRLRGARRLVKVGFGTNKKHRKPIITKLAYSKTYLNSILHHIVNIS